MSDVKIKVIDSDKLIDAINIGRKRCFSIVYLYAAR